MADLDSLNIRISADTTAATKAVDNLAKSLSSLNSYLSKTAEIGSFSAQMKDLAAGLREVSNVANKLNIEAVKSMASAFGTLGTNLAKLPDFGKGIATFSQEVTSSCSKTRSELEKESEEVSENLKWWRQRKAALQSIGATGVTSRTRAEAGDDFARLNGFGKNIGVHSTDVNPEIWSNYKRVTNEDLPANAEDAVLTYNRAIQECADNITNLTAREAELNAQMKAAPEVINTVASAYERLNGSDVVPVEHSSLFDLDMGIDEVIPKMEQVAQVAQEVTTSGTETGNTLQNIASGLSAFQGISVSKEQFSGVGTIATAAATLSTVDTSSLSANMTNVAQSLTQLTSVPTENAERLQTVASAVNAFGYASSEKAGTNIASVATNLTALNTAIPSGEKGANLTSLGNAVKLFGSAGARHAIENLPQLTTALRDMMNTLAHAPAVSTNTVKLAEAIAQFSGRAATATSTANRFGTSLIGIGARARHARLSFGSLASMFGRLYANFFLLIRGARLVGKAVGYSSQMTEAMNVVDVAFGKTSDKLKDFMTDSIKQFGLGRLAAAQYASRFQMMGKTMGISAEQIGKANDFIAQKISGNSLAYKDLGNSISDMSINLTKLTADMASLYNQDYDSVAQDMQAIYTGMTRPLRKYGIDLTNASMKEFALKNGLDADIASMSQAEKTLLRYQMVMTRASSAMGDFTKTADTWANSIRTVKQLLQEFGRLLGEALINTLKPALIAFKNFLYSLIQSAQNVLNAVGSLLGWSKIDFGGASLIEDMEDFADATDDAAGAAKKLKGQLRGIDELNNLTTNPGGGGGGGATDSGTAGGTDLWDKIKETKEKYESEIKSWYELGRKIADGIQNGLENIDWEGIKAKAKEGATNLANFLNGFFKPEMFYQAGKTIAEGINTGLEWLNTFAENFDFDNFGKTIAEGINGFFDNFDSELFGDTLDKWVNGLWESLKSLAKNLNWGAILEDVTEVAIDVLPIAITSFTLVTTANVISHMISGLIFGKLLTNPITLASVGIAITGGYLIGNGWGQIFAEIMDDEEMAEAYREANPFTKEGTASAKAAEEFWFSMFDWTKENPKTIAKTVSDPIKVIWDEIIDEIKRNTGMDLRGEDIASKTIFELIQSFLFPVGSTVERLIWLLDFIKKLKKNWKDLIDTFKNTKIGGGIFKFFDDLKLTFDDIKKRFEDFKLEMAKVFDEVFGSGYDGGETLPTLAKAAEKAGKLIGDTMIAGIKAVLNIDSFGIIGADIVDGIKKGVTDQSGKVSFKALFDNFKKGIKKIFGIASPAKEMNDVGENIVLGIFEGFDLVDFSAKMSEWWDNNVKPWFEIEKWKTIATNIKTAITAKWNEFVLKWIPSITNWWNNNVVPWFTLKKWKEIADNIRAGIVAKWNELKLWFDGAVQRFLDKAKEVLSYKNFFGIGENIGNGLKSPVETAINAMKTAWESFKQTVSAVITATIKFTGDTSQLKSAVDAIANSVSGLVDAGKKVIDMANQEMEDKGSTTPGSGGSTSGGKTSGNTKTEPKKNNPSKAGMPSNLRASLTPISSLTGGDYGIIDNTTYGGGDDLTGIRDAIVSTSNEELSLLRQQNELLTGILQKEFGISHDALFRSVRNSANDYLMRTGNPAF